MSLNGVRRPSNKSHGSLAFRPVSFAQDVAQVCVGLASGRRLFFPAGRFQYPTSPRDELHRSVAFRLINVGQNARIAFVKFQPVAISDPKLGLSGDIHAFHSSG